MKSSSHSNLISIHVWRGLRIKNFLLSWWTVHPPKRKKRYDFSWQITTKITVQRILLDYVIGHLASSACSDQCRALSTTASTLFIDLMNIYCVVRETIVRLSISWYLTIVHNQYYRLSMRLFLRMGLPGLRWGEPMLHFLSLVGEVGAAFPIWKTITQFCLPHISNKGKHKRGTQTVLVISSVQTKEKCSSSKTPITKRLSFKIQHINKCRVARWKESQ